MLWARGERLVAKSRDPLVSVSGAINKFHTVWPSGYGRKLINDNLQRLADTRKLPWCHGSNSVTRVWRKMPSNRCGHDATVTLGQYRCVCASCRGQDHDSCVREATSTLRGLYDTSSDWLSATALLMRSLTANTGVRGSVW
jgi:hypothetical protein